MTLIGAEPHPPYERPPLSKDAMIADDAGAEGDRRRRPASPSAGDRLPPGAQPRPRSTAPPGSVALATAAALPYDRLLLATGARPRPLPLPGADGAERRDAARPSTTPPRIRAALGPGRRLAVIGGGFIGLELAASARRLGAEVTVIEALPRLLTRGVPAEIAAVARRPATAPRACAFVFGARVARDHRRRRRCSPTAARSPPTSSSIGIGAVPDTGARRRRAGSPSTTASPSTRGLATADPAIFAAGDCCSFPHPLYGHRRVRLESWRSAQEQGSARRAQHARRRRAGHGGALVLVGPVRPDAADRRPRRRAPRPTVRRAARATAPSSSSTSAPDGRLLAASGIGPGNAVAKDIRLAEMMIARGLRPDPAALAAPATNLKKLLAA